MVAYLMYCLKVTLAFFFGVLTLLCISTVGNAQAATFGSGTYGKCTYDACSITVNSSGAVALAVTPTASGKCSTAKDDVTVTTVNSSGFSLTLMSTVPSTDLANGSNAIAAVSAAQGAPTLLSANTWGYRVDDIGGFGSGPATAQTNANTSIFTFAGIPASTDSSAVIANTNSAASPPVTTPVWYGVCANTNLTSGTYTGQVLYSAVVN